MKLYLLSIVYFPITCLAYGSVSHAFLGQSLANAIFNTSNTTIIEIQKIIPLSKFEYISSWADVIKRKYKWSAPLHYIDIDTDECKNQITLDLNQYCNNNCIYTGILNMTNTLYLRDLYINDTINLQESFKFLLHFLQDLHQPLHLTGWYRGGNSWNIDILKNGKIIHTNFHSLWDTYLPEHYIITYKPLLIYNKKPSFFKNILEYKDYLNEYIQLLAKYACLIRNTNTHVIDFESYFDEHLYILEYMFQRYIEMSINTFTFIFNK
jgi:hypothetical protein